MRRLFISHSWSYEERYTSMVNLLDNKDYFSWINYSVPTDKAFEGMNKSELQEQLRKQIRPVNCVIIIGGMWTAYSEWIQFEIDFAVSINKPILGVKPRSGKVMPSAVTNATQHIVNWSTDSIVAKVREIEI